MQSFTDIAASTVVAIGQLYTATLTALGKNQVSLSAIS